MLPSGFEPELAEFFFHLEIKTFELNRKSAVLAGLDDRSYRRCLSEITLTYFIYKLFELNGLGEI